MGHSKRLACSIHDAPSGEFFDTFQCVANSTSPLNPWLQPRTGLQERQAGPDLWPCMSPCQLHFPPSETRWQFLPRNLAGIQSKSTPSLQEVGRRVIETLLGDSLCKFSDNGTGDTDCKEGERGPHDPSAHDATQARCLVLANTGCRRCPLSPPASRTPVAHHHHSVLVE